MIIFIGCVLFWFLLYKLYVWEHKEETPEEQEERYDLITKL